MRLKIFAFLCVLLGSTGLAYAPPPPEPEDIFSLFGLPLDSNVEYLAIAITLYGCYALSKNYKQLAKSIFAK